HIVDAERPTHFTNLLSGKYNVIGQNSMYNWAITNRGGEYRTDPYWLAREIAAIGYNAFMGHSADGSLLYQIGRPGQEVEELVREMPGLGPWEGWYVPGGRDQFLDAALRYGLHFWENALSYNDTSLPRGEKILDACHRYTTLEAASMRHNPAFQGISLYDEIYERSLIDSTGIVNVFDKAREVGYRARYEGMTSNEAEKSLARFLGRSPQNRNYKDLEKYITWPRWGDYQWQMLTDRCTEGIKLAMPDSQNFALKRSGYNAGDPLSMHGTPDTVFSSLDIAGCVEYKDGGFGDLPVFGPVHADALKARDDIKVFTQLHDCGPGIYGNHVFRQAFFSISQKEHGLIFFNIPHDPRSPQQLDYRETVRNIAQRLTTPYGDLVYDAEPGYRKVAIYASRTADYVDRIMHQCGRLWVGCIRAGFPADFLLDPHVLAGKGRDYDVIFVPGWRNEKQCPPDILAAIERLVNAGKIVAVERTCKLPIEGLVRMDFPLDEWMPATGMTWLDQQTYSMWRGTEQITKRVRDFLTARGVPPVAQHNLTVGPDWLRVRNGMYLVLPDLADTNFAGLHLTLYQAPEVATLRLPRRDGAWYDMLEMKRIEPKSDGDWLVLDADMREYPGKIIAVLPAAIGSVSLQASAKVRAGSDVQYRVAVVDAAGAAIDAGFPLEISIADSAGRALTKIYRTAKPEYAAAWRVPVNAAPPSITLRVRELISGAVAEAAVEVQPSSLPSAEIDTRPVRICDASRIAEFIKTKHTILIAQSPEQQWCRQAAARLAEALAARGLQAKIVDPHSVIRWPAPWNPNAPTVDGSRLWRGHVVEPGMFIDSPVIVLGRRDENVLIEALIRRSLLAEPLTEHFPGAGKALLAWTPRAFSAHHDTLSILAEDEAGLNRGIDALATIDARTPSDPARPVIAAPAFDPAAKLAPAGKHAVEPTSFAQVIGHKDAIRCIEADPATGSILVGTFGYGQNLFCFAKDGSLRWKQFLPDHDVYAAHWCDSGRRVVAGTGEGYWIYVLNGSDGAVVRKFKASHWSNFHWAEGPINTHADIIVQADLKQIIVRGITALFAVDFDGNKLWLYDKAEDFTRYPEKAEQEGTAQFDETGAFAGPPLLIENGTKILQPEKYVVGSRIAAQTETVYVWANRNVVLDAKTGSVLAGSNDDVAGPAPPAWQPNVDAIIEGEAETGHPWIRELDAVDAAGTRLYRCDRDG
ncbi:MAG TPA: hypothetical protein VM223_20970, partial [Planctomycetota bacterium]|nr:hypothetical protein [Planctomycetota bacterium]